MTCDRSVIFIRYSVFLYNKSDHHCPRYSVNIVESGIKHHKPVKPESHIFLVSLPYCYFNFSQDATCLELMIVEFICIFLSKMRRWKNNPEYCCKMMFFFIFSWLMVCLSFAVWYCVSANIPPNSSSGSKKGNYYIPMHFSYKKGQREQSTHWEFYLNCKIYVFEIFLHDTVKLV